MSGGGFFKNFHETVTRSLDDVVRNNFVNLETNDKRVSYMCGLPVVQEYDLSSQLDGSGSDAGFPVRKDAEKGRQLKTEGNDAVLKGDWLKALQLYSQSLIYMPQCEGEEVAILLANRSAALNHLEQHEDALADIRRCLVLGYPRHLQYKVKERRARCLLVLKRNQEAITAFRDTITALDESKLDTVKKQKMTRDAQLMIEILAKGQSMAGNPKDPEPRRRNPPKPKLPGKHNPLYPAASEAIRIDQEEGRGRFATATRDIEAGEILLTEKPYSGVLLAEYSKTHCQCCFAKCIILLPCPKCSNVVFCSEKCLETSLKTFHGYECPILPLLWRSGCSITCHLALRMITQNTIEHFQTVIKKPEIKANATKKAVDYRAVSQLVTHGDKRTKDDLLHRTQMAVFLVKMLELNGYLDGKTRDREVSLDDIKSMAVTESHGGNVELIGGIVLQNLQIVQFNAHEVFELQCPKPSVGGNVIKHDGKSVFIAGAVFPTLALFNHSCDPGVVRYFSGPSIVVRAVKNILKGQEVAENYGSIFTTVPKDKRQADLREQYWFDCSCVPCQQDWSLYDDMVENYMRFKCDSDQPCDNVVAVPHDCKDFMVQCGLCHQYTNILKGLKSLQDTDMMFRLGQHAMTEGKYGEAFKQFVEVLKLFDATLVSPYRSYYDCVQNLRRCMLAMGNYSIA